MPYWRDVGTLDAYYQANMDLIAVDPVLNLYDQEWPIRTYQPQLPPPKFVFSDEGPAGHARRGEAHDSMVCQGCIISGGQVRRQHPVAATSASTVTPWSRIRSCSTAWTSAGTAAFAGPSSTRTCRIPPGTTIGYDLEHDQQRGFTVTEQGVVVIAKAELPETFTQ